MRPLHTRARIPGACGARRRAAAAAPRLDREALVEQDRDRGEREVREDLDRRVVEADDHAARLLREAPARPGALRALPEGAELLEGRLGARLVDVAAVGAHPLARPVALRLELLLGRGGLP